MSSWIDDLNGVVGALGSVAGTVVDTKNSWSGKNNQTTQNNTSLDNLASSIATSASQNKKTILLIGGGALVLIALFIFIKR